jgi:tRNA modification GTPase
MEKAIAAISTPNAIGGISVVRISGDQALTIADRVFKSISGKILGDMKGYTAAYGRVFDKDGDFDDAVALVFRAPKSYTGEDVVEVSCHGGIYVTRRLLRAMIDGGASPAAGGEFTKRAFLNGKLSLTQAESVMDIINSHSKQAARSAMAGFEGALFKKIQNINERLLNLSGHLAAWVDFPEEDIPVVEHDYLLNALGDCGTELNDLINGYDAGRLIHQGIVTAIVGKPNVGKSTLMNLLAGCEKSIVTEIAGTTRDVVEESVLLGDVVLRLADTAGIRDTEDMVERVGVSLAKKKMEQADLVLAVFDGSSPLSSEDQELIAEIKDKNVIAVVNKSDLENKLDIEYIQKRIKHIVIISAKNTNGLQELSDCIAGVLNLVHVDTTGAMLANERQRDCVQRAVSFVEESVLSIRQGFTLDAVTVSIELAIEDLLELTGERVTDAVVDEVFSHFCVGK